MAAKPVQKYNRSSPGVRRILKEAQEIANSPSRDFTAYPLEHDLYEWHFTLRGPPEPSPFDGGFYHGRIILSPNYPMRPPMFRFLTDSGRFEVNRDICLSISGFHEETWQPSWSIRLALTALRAHMDSEPAGQVGGIFCDTATRKALAMKSREYKCPDCGGGGEEEAMKVPEEEEGSSSNPEPEIPPELRFGYKDEMKPHKDDAEAKAAEGTSTATPSSAPSAPQQPAPPVAAAAQDVPTPTQPQQEQQPAAQQREPERQEVIENPAMFMPLGRVQQQAMADLEMPQLMVAPAIEAAAPRQLGNTNEDQTNGYIDLAIGALVSILVALILRKM
ncbi:hypothetical protein TWF281_009249 [Arthrobotrys megalospora]